jgi:hypothetical protein
VGSQGLPPLRLGYLSSRLVHQHRESLPLCSPLSRRETDELSRAPLLVSQKMDLGSCPRTHSVKLKNEYEALMKKAEADKDEPKVAELNRLKVDYEQTVRSSLAPCRFCWRKTEAS